MSGPDEEVVTRAQARLRTVLRGKYRLDRVVGVGGMATVYAATHRNGKEFAVKLLHPELASRNEIRARFVREGYVANSVKHPGAVSVLDDDVDEDGTPFLVMELLHGQTLESLWQRHDERLPLPLIAGVVLQVLDVLAAAHSRGIVHRDIKPDNTMIAGDGQVKILDFGIARLRDAASVRTTQTGFTMGTPAFMAPEHALAKTDEIDARTDLWAVGAMMFTLASGRLVHQGDNAQQLLVFAATTPAPRLATVMPRVAATWCEVVDRALEFEKLKRWASAKDMANALEGACLATLGSVPSAESLAAMVEELEAGAARPRGPAVGNPEAPTPAEPVASASGGHGRTLASTTAEPVATDPMLPRGARAQPFVLRGNRVALGMSVLLILVVTGTAFAIFEGAGRPSRVNAIPSSTADVPAPPAAPDPTTAPLAPAAVTQAPTVIASSERHVADLPAPSVSPAGRARPRSAPPLSPGPPSSTAPTPPQGPKHNCNPPFEIDEQGNKRWKRDCL